MYSTAHLALGLIIGKATGDYPTAIISSVAIDLDHLIPHAKKGFLFKWGKIWQEAKSAHDSSRSYLHSFFGWAVLSGLICLFDLEIGLIFSLGYLGHFFLDTLDNSDFWPIFPIKKYNVKGFIGYYSKGEFFFTLLLYLIFFLL